MAKVNADVGLPCVFRPVFNPFHIIVLLLAVI